MLFLETCPHLREFAEGYRQGARYSAKINNMCLLDYLSNRPMEGKCGNSVSTDHQVQSSPQLNEDLLISTITNTITKAFDEISGKQAERHDQSFQQIKEERMELKSQLLDSIQHDLFAKIRDTMKSVECSIIETLEERRNQRYSLADLQMPKTPR